jgi:hypothetical protein
MKPFEDDVITEGEIEEMAAIEQDLLLEVGPEYRSWSLDDDLPEPAEDEIMELNFESEM